MSNNQWNGGQWPSQDWTPETGQQPPAQQGGWSDQTQISAQQPGTDWNAPQASANDWNAQQQQAQASANDWTAQQPAQNWTEQQPSAQDWNAQQPAQDWAQQPQASANDWTAQQPQASANDWSAQQPEPSAQDWNAQQAAAVQWNGATPAPYGQQQWQQPAKPSTGFGNVFDFSFKRFALPEAAGTIFLIGTIAILLNWLLGLIGSLVNRGGEYDVYYNAFDIWKFFQDTVWAFLWILLLRAFLEGMSALVKHARKDDDTIN